MKGKWVTEKITSNVWVTYYKKGGDTKMGRHRKVGRPKGSKTKHRKHIPFRIRSRGAIYQFHHFTKRGRTKKR